MKKSKNIISDWLDKYGKPEIEKQVEKEIEYINKSKMEEEIENALMEAIWIMRWTDNNEALHSVLEVEEAEKMVQDIVKELDKAGYEITKKQK